MFKNSIKALSILIPLCTAQIIDENNEYHGD